MTPHASTPRRDPVSLVLGPTPPGPFGLLGLDTEDVGVTRVLAALHERLAQVSASPHAATPAAEDVRLALHAAAAQLCDPAVRRLLLGAWASNGAEQANATEALRSSLDARLAIERDLHIAVGLSGGWNAAAMQRLALACGSRGVGLHEIAVVLEGIGARRAAPATGLSRNPVHPGSLRQDDGETPSSGLPRDLLLLLGMGVAAVVLVVVGLVLWSGPRRGSARPEDVIAALETEPRPAERLRLEESPPKASATPSDLGIDDARGFVREFSALAAILTSADEQGTDPDAFAARFDRAYGSMCASWHLLRRDEMTAITSSLIDLAFAAVQRQRESEVVQVMVAALAQPPKDRRSVRMLVASAAFASRLLQERELPRGVLERIEGALRASAITRELGPTSRFDLAAEQIVLPLASGLDPGSELSVWKGFIDVRDAALGDRVRAKDASTLVALDSVMRSRADDAAASEESVLFLAGSLSWTKSPELRAAITGWFADAAIPTPRLAALTRAMVKSSIRGIDSTMTLATTASVERRQELRGVIEVALRDDSGGVGLEAARAWVAAAEGVLDRSATKPEVALELAAQCSELVAARQAQLEGFGDLAARLTELSATASALPAGSQRPALPTASPGSKAIEYASLGASQAARTEFWKKRLSEGEPSDMLLARLAIEEAARGSPAGVRDAARDFVRARAGDDAIVMAALDLTFAIPETPENAEWLSAIAGRKLLWRGKGATREAVHRALLEVAAARFAQPANAAAIDAAAERLARSWIVRSGETPAEDAVSPADALRRLEKHLLGVGSGINSDRVTYGDIRQRLNARLNLATEPLQAAVWRQAACVEVMAADAIRRNPPIAGEIDQALRSWEEKRRRAANAFEQLLEGERATVRVLLIDARSAIAAGGGA
ncbi:MAG: hypothetical protein K2Y21_14455 [Phycisphaerales bacterium]|nr:hypothetical protein [Phycisphaerales bacterium]